MEPGDVSEVTIDGCSDLYYVDTGMYDTAGYGAAYVLDADRPAIVEAGIGTNYEYLLEALDEIGIDSEALEVVAVTHIHLDHAGGAGFLVEACPNADVYVPSVGAGLLAEPSRLVAGTKAAVGDQWQYYVEPEPIPDDRIVEIDDGDVIDLGNHELHVHGAPGHAFHQVIFDDPVNETVFTGDAAGIWIPDLERIKETSPPSDFDLEECLDDLETIRELDPNVLCYTHFGPRDVSDDLDEVLDEYATVLTEWVEAVDAKREELEADRAVIDYFVSNASLPGAWNERKVRAEAELNTRGVLDSLEE
ncbi:MBL fold metallo-hydrolase [Natrarchaeobaculum sulfurireducens]|uniref:Metal-dependent hydrolase of the beta-lactamase superfamily II n=1 Tax=Natrarchaeobaculum sulfurireducens TaxID=2044521 RepID=A0A346PJ67_9EURY|nr:MBL fold metallo-hydrolase [Natrarchaeobaculum sulfurireducens]AXR79562.1 Metal-dependent hydrolase of the beta-lactamase superfamily II [Natrarchaeobaculum sulfurireducens]